MCYTSHVAYFPCTAGGTWPLDSDSQNTLRANSIAVFPAGTAAEQRRTTVLIGGPRMGEQPTYPWHVMISSTMVDLPREREVARAVIVDAGLTPWYAEQPPREFEVSGYQLSVEMAQRCDLYLLIVGSRYGSRPEGMPPGDTRSVTHLEFDIARAANPRKIRVFMPADADSIAESDEQHEFLRTLRHFSQGPHYYVYDRHNLDTLRDHIAHAIAQWIDPAGRDAYVAAVRQDYETFRNAITGQEMDYDATVLLKLRSEVETSARRAGWEDQLEDEDRERRDKEQNRGARAERSREERASRRIREAARPLIKTAGEFLDQFSHLVLLGDVGSGKSTLLHRLAHDTANAYLNERAVNATIPVLVRAADLGRLNGQQPDLSLGEALGVLKEDETRAEGLKPLIRAIVAEAVARGEALVLVDGLDEAAQVAQQAVFMLLRQIGTNRAILASRPASYAGQLPDWRVCDLQRLDPAQRRQLITQVFRSLIAEDEALPDPDTLERELDRRGDLFAWAGNPLLLTLIAAQYARDRRLPENRARIYQFALEDMQRQRPPTARRLLTREELDRLLQVLALRMAEDATRFTTEAAAERYLAGDLIRISPTADDSLKLAMAAEVLERSGVLQQQPGGRWEFVHLSFREYLTASALAAATKRARAEVARRRRLSAQWEQVFLLLVSRLDGEQRYEDTDDLLRALIDADRQRVAALGGSDPSHQALKLATTCHLSRPIGRKRKAISAKLRRAWLPLWRRSIRRTLVGYNLYTIELLDLVSDLKFAPTDLARSAAPALAPHFPGWSRQTRRGLIVAPLLATVVLVALLYLLNLLLTEIGPPAATPFASTFHRWLPATLLALLALYALLRILLRRNSVSQVTLRTVLAAPEVFKTLTAAELGRMMPLLLHRLAQDGTWDVRQAAAQALAAALPALGERAPAELLTEQVLPLLLRQLAQDEDWEVRRAVAQALAAALSLLGERAPELLREQVLPLLLNRLAQDENWRVRRALAQALGTINTRDSVALMLPLRQYLTRPKGTWLVRGLAMVQRAADAPIILAAMLSQILILWPALRTAAPLPPFASALWQFTSWWQALLLGLIYLAVYVFATAALALFGQYRNDTWDTVFDIFEGKVKSIEDVAKPEIGASQDE
jgi:hypothetical protein